MESLKFIEKAKDNCHFSGLLMPTSMAKSEMKQLHGGGYFCDAGCEAPGWSIKNPFCPSQVQA